MKQISTGAGLVALSVGMVATAFIATQRGGGEAFAIGSAIDRQISDKSAPREGVACETSQQARTVHRSNADPDSCSVRIEQWFVPEPRSLNCVFTLGTYIPTFTCSDPADHLGGGPSRSSVCGRDPSTGLYFLDVLDFGHDLNDRVVMSRIRVLTSSFDLNFWQTGGGWIDIDGDGDLDIVQHRWPDVVWFENIAGDSVQQNPYDLDQDGNVNNGDLSLLLLNFD